mmetsp:Transcript_24604/g.51714  ORF Transcript_24604/g.51714 Transcript_24604/m.51714 type:complete len:218 (-) Transcript_24604:354-1007(-)
MHDKERFKSLLPRRSLLVPVILPFLPQRGRRPTGARTFPPREIPIFVPMTSLIRILRSTTLATTIITRDIGTATARDTKFTRESPFAGTVTRTRTLRRRRRRRATGMDTPATSDAGSIETRGTDATEDHERISARRPEKEECTTPDIVRAFRLPSAPSRRTTETRGVTRLFLLRGDGESRPRIQVAGKILVLDRIRGVGIRRLLRKVSTAMTETLLE